MLFDTFVRRLLNSFNLPLGILNYIVLMHPEYPDGETEARKRERLCTARTRLADDSCGMAAHQADAGFRTALPAGVGACENHRSFEAGTEPPGARHRL